jgi:hypothetical protein
MSSSIDAARVRANAEKITKQPASMRVAMKRGMQGDIDALRTQLGAQYDWLNAHRDDPRHNEREDRWLDDLAHYVAAVDALASVTQLELVL